MEKQIISADGHLYNADGGLQDLGFLLGDQLLLGKESLKNWRWVSMSFSK